MAYYDITSGVTSAGLSLNNDSMYISNGGVASRTTAEEYSNIYVSEGGLAKDTTLNSGGQMIVSEGGAANRATVNSSGFLYVYESGSATEVIENGGYVNWSEQASVTFKPNAFSGLVIESYGTATLHSGTTANSATVNSGYLYVYSGGTANGATVNSYGALHVSEGGTANSATVNSYGYASVFSGGTLNGATVNSSGYVSVYSGGSAQSATVNSGGSLYVTEGAKATEIIENGGYVSVSYGAKAKFRANTFDGAVLENYENATVHSGTTANNTTLNSAGRLYVFSGGKANGAKVNSGGSLTVSEGGALNNATVNNSGRMYVYGGSAGGVTVNIGGVLYINGNAKATEIRENGGYVSVGSASVKFKANTISGLTLESNSATAHSGTTVNKLTVSMGIMNVNGGKVNDATVNLGGVLQVYAGGKANGVTMNTSCNVYVYNGGTADKIKVRGGYLSVSSGGKATNVDWTPCEGHITVSSGATVKFVSKYSGVYFGSGGKLLSSGGTMNGKTLDQNYEMNVMTGGTAENTTVNSGGSLYVSSGGSAENTTVNFRGFLVVSSGGTADRATLNSSGYMDVSEGGAANGTTVSSSGIMYVYRQGLAKDTAVFDSGYMGVNSGGTAGHITVSGGRLTVSSAAKATNIVWNPCEGEVVVSSGGTASFASKYSGVYFGSGGKLLSHAETMDGRSLNENYEMHVMSGGIANDTEVNSGGSMYVHSGGTVENTEVNFSGSMYVSSGAAINNTTVNGGSAYISSGAMADGVTVNDQGYAVVRKAANVTVNSGGEFRVESRGIIDNLTVNDGGSASIYSKSVVNNAAVNAGFLSADTVNDLAVNSGGTAHVKSVNTAMVNAGGSMYVSSGGSGVTIDGGVVSVGVTCDVLSDTTIYSNGTMSVRQSAYGVSVHSGGSLYVFDGMADSATVYNGGEMIVSYGSATNVTVQTGGSMTVSDGDLFGSMTFATGAVVSMDDYTTVHFDIADLTPDDCQLPFVNNISVITGTPQYRLNLSAIQDFGTYTLAGGAAGFSGSVYCETVDDTGLATGYMLTVGDTVDIYGAGHTLKLDGDLLTLTVGMATDPVDPDDGGWNDYLYDKKTKTLNESVYYLNPKTINEESKEIVVDETGTIRNGGMHNFIGESDVSGRIDSADFTKIQLDSAAKLCFTITATNAMKFTVWSLTEGTDKKGNETYTMKALQTVTAKNGWVDTCKKPLLLEAGEYYVSMELANPKKPGTGYYSVQIDDFDGHSEFYTKANKYDDWDDVKERGPGGYVGHLGTLSEDTWEILSGEWVGFSDAVDYMGFTIESAACLRFYLDATDATKFTIWQLNGKADKNGKTTYSLKSLQATTLKKEGDGFYFADTKDLILDAGTYYFSMESTNAKKGASATYNVSLSGALFYTQANNSDDWTDMKTDGEFGLVENVGVLDSGTESVVSDWVGYSDAIDYKKFTLSRKTSLSFRVSAENATKFTVWQLNEKTDKKGNTTYSLKSLDSVKLKEFEEIETRTLSLSAGTYYFSMESTNAKKGGSALYNVSIGTFVEADSLSAALAMPEADLSAGLGLNLGGSGADVLADASAFDKLATLNDGSAWQSLLA